MVNVVLNRYKNLRHIGCLHSAGKGRIIMEYTFTAANFEEEVLQSELPVLVDFYADWCGPCKMLAPILEELDGVAPCKIVKVDVDENRALALQYAVASIPTLLVFRNGQLVNRSVGLISREDVLKLVQA